VRGPLRKVCVVFIAAVLSSSCANTRVYNEGIDALDNGRYEEGLSKLEEAVRNDPRNIKYQADLRVRRDIAVAALYTEGDRARRAADFQTAERAYGRVLAVAPGNEGAKRGLENVAQDRRHLEITARAETDLNHGDLEQAENKIRAVLDEDPTFPPAVAVLSKIETARGPIPIMPHLKSHDNRPVTLQFRDANTKMVFEVLSRQTGINFVFDKDVKSDGKTTIFVQQVPVEEAIELVLGQNQLARQVLSDNMVMIYPNTAVKQKEYQDEIVKTFYFTNADPKKAQELLKTVLNSKTLFVDDKASLLVMRDTPEAVRMAEKLVASLDLVDAEVMMEVEVLEITRSSLQQLGIQYPTTATLATPTNLTLANVGHLGKSDISVTPLSVTIDALKQVGRADTLASPRIRARSREKAKVLIGSREPVITNSVTPTSAGPPVVTGSVQYLDVGLTLEVEPTVHLDNQVSIKMNLEVSSILKQITTSSGTVAYEIGTRNAQTLLSLKDGETQILAGLIQDSDTRNSNHIPGLGDIPIIGKLFGSDHIDKEKSEIVLSITPRIIRASGRPSHETTEFWYGTESNLRSAPLGMQSGASSGGQPGSGGAAPSSGTAPATFTSPATGAVPANGTVPAPDAAPATGAASSTSAEAAPVSNGASSDAVVAAAAMGTAVVAAASAPMPPETSRVRAAPEPNPDGPDVTWTGPTEAKTGDSFDVAIRLSTKQPLARISSQLHFDGSILQLDGVDTGNVIPSALPSPASPRINQHAGVVQYVVAAGKVAPIQGDGGFLVLHFKALAPSPSTSVTLQFVAADADGHNVRANIPAPLMVAVIK
jgi:general secretion pathway protein D